MDQSNRSCNSSPFYAQREIYKIQKEDGTTRKRPRRQQIQLPEEQRSSQVFTGTRTKTGGCAIFNYSRKRTRTQPHTEQQKKVPGAVPLQKTSYRLTTSQDQTKQITQDKRSPTGQAYLHSFKSQPAITITKDQIDTLHL